MWAEDAVSLVLWYRGDTGIPIYRVDARNMPLSKSKHLPSEPLAKRIYFDVGVRPPALRIDPVTEADAGEYRCRVDYRKTRTQNYMLVLNITCKQELLSIQIQSLALFRLLPSKPIYIGCNAQI